MDAKQIVSELQNTLNTLCKKYNIADKSIRIMVFIQGPDIKFSLFNDQRAICELDLWKDILDIKVRMFYMARKDEIINLVTAYMGNAIVKYAQQEKFDFAEAFLLIYKDAINNAIAAKICHKSGKSAALNIQEIFEPENVI